MIERCTCDDLNICIPGEYLERLSQELNCSTFVASLLWMKGIHNDGCLDEGRRWLSPDLFSLIETMELGKNSEKAALIFSKINEGTRVVVYGDYDVDGMTSTAIISELARFRKARVRYYIPHRFEQGYGLHVSVVEKIIKAGCDLLIVVDCGTQDCLAVEKAKKMGVPVIIFDHHLVQDKTAQCDALINPQIDGDALACQLCAAGVVWVWAWKNNLASPNWLLHLLQLTALATIADCVSLSSHVNRALVREGIKVLKEKPRSGLYCLLKSLSIDLLSVDAETLAMKVIPCLNAAGRLEIADIAMKILFPTNDIQRQVDHLIALNTKRRALSSKIISDAEMQREGQYKHVLYEKDWPVGVLSSVASRISTERKSPIALVGATNNSIRGTLRMPDGGDAVAVLQEISDCLKSWGGHRLAAGFSVTPEDWPNVRSKLEHLLAQTEILPQKINLLSWNPGEIDMALWKEVEEIGPFGIGNPHPLLYQPQIGAVETEPLGRNGKHLKIVSNGTHLLGFDGQALLREVTPKGWIYRPRLDTWNRVQNLQFIVEKVVL